MLYNEQLKCSQSQNYKSNFSRILHKTLSNDIYEAVKKREIHEQFREEKKQVETDPNPRRSNMSLNMFDGSSIDDSQVKVEDSPEIMHHKVFVQDQQVKR